MSSQMILTLAGALAVVLYFTVQHYLAAWYRKPKSYPAFTPCEEGRHRWRSIAAPYSRQCRKCGAVQFREDENGNFPDGLEEYFGYVSRLPQDARLPHPPPPDLCHCGAQMEIAQDEDLGEIWLCSICGSWKKTAKQDKLDTEAIQKERENPS